MDATTTTIDAVFSGGVLRPLGEVNLAENEQVRLTITPAPKPLPPEFLEWIARTAAHRQAMREEGYCHDSTELISEMRRRES